MGLTADAPNDAPADTPQRPSILVVGPRAVGKRSLVRRLVRGAKSAQASVPGGVVTSHRWSIDTKYYTADVNLWVSHSDDLSEDAAKAQALAGGCDALVMVFDLSKDASFTSVQEWASSLELAAFDVLLCIANKADLVPDHHAHETLQHQRPLQWEQRHRLVEAEDISRPEGSVPPFGQAPKTLAVRRQEYSEWCLDNGVEYIEACALDEHFDQRISADGDMQGISRLRSALHAHMWPGMVMKPKPGTRPPNTLSSGDESDSSIEYELLEEDGGRGLSPEEGVAETNVAAGAFSERGDELAGDARGRNEDGGRRGADSGKAEERRAENGAAEEVRSSAEAVAKKNVEKVTTASLGRRGDETLSEAAPAVALNSSGGSGGASDSTSKEASPSLSQRQEEGQSGPSPSGHSPAGSGEATRTEEGSKESKGGGPLVLDEASVMREVEHEGDSDYAEMERIMQEMASVRDRLSGLPDVVRREEAARYAMRMMQMFGGEESDVEAD